MYAVAYDRVQRTRWCESGDTCPRLLRTALHASVDPLVLSGRIRCSTPNLLWGAVVEQVAHGPWIGGSVPNPSDVALVTSSIQRISETRWKQGPGGGREGVYHLGEIFAHALRVFGYF